MTDAEKQQASDIFTKPAKQWTDEENKFLAALVKKGERQALKSLRASVA